MRDNILITGGAGYIGSALAEKLVRLGYNVTLYDSLRYGQHSVSNLEFMLNSNRPIVEVLSSPRPEKTPRDFRFVKGDTRDEEKLTDLFEQGKFDYVIHLGELVGVSCCRQDPTLTHDVNYRGTMSVIMLTAKYGARLIWNSSSSVYGEKGRLPNLLGEDTELRSKMDDYCSNKVQVERALASFAARNPDFKYVVLRPATVGGLSPRMRLELLPNHFTFAGAVNGRLTVDNPTHYRAVIGIQDMVNAYITILLSREWHNGTFNLGSVNLTKEEVIEEIRRVIDPKRFDIAIRENAEDIRNLKISTKKFAATFGYEPKTGFSEIVTPLAQLLKEDKNVFDRTGLAKVLNISLEEWERILK